MGYNTLAFDPANEGTIPPFTFGQTNGLVASANADGVILEGNFVTTSGGAAAYAKTSGPGSCFYINGTGTKTLTGLFNFGGPTVQVASNIAASITPDCTAGTDFVINGNSGVAYTINAPLNPMHDMRISITIQNTSGGALGAATFNAIFKMTAWTNPANGFQR